MVSVGGTIVSLIFGFFSDIFGRRSVIRSTLFMITLMTFCFAGFSHMIDRYYLKEIENFENNKIDNNDIIDDNFHNIIKQLYVQEKIRNKFREIFLFFVLLYFFKSWTLAFA